jgi:tetratricopeptide (TPR) repeat protein
MNIRTLNLLWDEKVRGSYPVSSYALNDAGTLVRGIPRPTEPRNYDLTHLHRDGTVEKQTTFTTQTLLELEISTEAGSFLGMTANEVYLFHNTGKVRLLPDRRLVFVDTGICASGQRVVVGYSDIAGTNFEVASGDMRGSIEWILTVDTPLSAVTISRDGAYIAFGTEVGSLVLITSRRKQVWQFNIEEPIHSVACSEKGDRVLYGTTCGTVGCIVGDGTRIWDFPLVGDVVSVAISAQGEVCAALVYGVTEEDGSRLLCFNAEGAIGWEHRFEKRLVGLSLSPQGNYLATSLRDGTAMLYEVVMGDALPQSASRSLEDPLLQAQAFLEVGATTDAYQVLKNGVAEQPANLVLFDLYTQTQKRWFEENIAFAQAHFTAQEYLPALSILETMLTLEPQNVSLVSLLNQARQARAKQCLTQAQDENTDKEALLREAIRLQPTVKAFRESLANLYEREVANDDQAAEALLANGRFEEGIAALERAQAIAPTPARAKRLERAQIALDFETGMELYNAKQYSPAIFQFQKVLSRDPNHAEAKRYLQFSQRFTQDSSTSEVQSRFSMLE